MIYSLKNVLHGKHIMQPFYTLAYPRWEYCVYKLNPGFPKFICLLNSFAFQHLKAAISPGSVEYTSINGDTIWKNCFCSMISGAEAGILLFTARLPQRGVIVIPVTLSFYASHQHCLCGLTSPLPTSSWKVSLSNTCCFYVRETISIFFYKTTYFSITPENL